MNIPYIILPGYSVGAFYMTKSSKDRCKYIHSKIVVAIYRAVNIIQHITGAYIYAQAQYTDIPRYASIF